MEDYPYQVRLPVFEGPLDLLLHLININEIDICNIPIAQITSEYLEYINLMRELNLEIASEFLLMAATLIYIKSKMLLPNPPEEDIVKMNWTLGRSWWICCWNIRGSKRQPNCLRNGSRNKGRFTPAALKNGRIMTRVRGLWKSACLT